MNQSEINEEARQEILNSIRSHLATSVPYDQIYTKTDSGIHAAPFDDGDSEVAGCGESLVNTFSENLEVVDGHCLIVSDDESAADAVNEIISSLGETALGPHRTALSDAPIVQRISGKLRKVEYVSPADGVSDLFTCDVGITSAQTAIAETGTLVLDASRERHRLASLLPPVHIAIINESQICLTLAEALAGIQARGEISPTVTFITGPSRTADIELTLAIGVHGPQKLYVIVIKGM